MDVKKISLYCDGGARGNPGPAALGVVIKMPGGDKGYGQFLGKRTNNEAEYEAAIFGLKKMKQLVGKKNLKDTIVVVYSDSELMVRQITGQYKIQNVKLQPLFLILWNLTLDFQKVDFQSIPREENKEADALVNQVLDKEARSKKLL